MQISTNSNSQTQAASSEPIPCFVVNLAQATERRQAMQAQLASHGIQAQFVDAVDGRRFSDAEREAQVDRVRAAEAGWALSPSEIGCALSHWNIYREMVARNLPCAVVLEDDVVLAEGFARLLTRESPECLARRFAPDEPAMVQLTHVGRAWRWPVHALPSDSFPAATQGLQAASLARLAVVRPFGGVWLTSGYFLTLAAARNLVQALHPVWSVADDWGRFQQLGLVRLHALTPNVVWEAESAQASSIAQGRSRNARGHRRTLGYRLARLWRDAVTRPLLTRRLPRRP